jgi:hypothetical protein
MDPEIFISIVNTACDSVRPGRLGLMMESIDDPWRDQAFSEDCSNVMATHGVIRSMVSQSL